MLNSLSFVIGYLACGIAVCEMSGTQVSLLVFLLITNFFYNVQS